MIQPRLVWELARKDLQLFLTDRRGALLCFGVPIILASVFGAIFHRPDNAETIRPAVKVVDQDQSQRSRTLVTALCQSDKLRADVCELESAKRRLAMESGEVVVILPPGMEQSVRRGHQPTIEILHHPRDEYLPRWVEGVLTEIVMRQYARELLGPLAGKGLKMDRPFRVEHHPVPAVGALAAHSYSHAFCGMTLQYLLFWGMDSGLLLLRERRGGIWRRLRSAPVSRGSLLAGKALATALVALAQIGCVFSFGAIVFGVGVNGSVVGFIMMALAAALLSAATGLVVAAVGGTEGRARSVSILVILTLSLLSGLWLPAFLLPSWAQRMAELLPTTWAARGLEGVTWQGMNLSGAATCAGILTGFSVAFLILAWWRLTRTEPVSA